jgi:hypothetical protein
MARYGLSTYVLTSYVSDFHGTTVELFEKRTPDAETNKAVCYDCHGIHDIQSTRDPEAGLSLQANLLARCQLCHPDATANFPAAWLSHYEPSAEKYPVVYYVNLFYAFFIPGMLGGMGLLVVLDVYKSFRVRMQAASRPGRQPTPEAAATEEAGSVVVAASSDQITEAIEELEEVMPAEQHPGEAAEAFVETLPASQPAVEAVEEPEELSMPELPAAEAGEDSSPPEAIQPPAMQSDKDSEEAKDE